MVRRATARPPVRKVTSNRSMTSPSPPSAKPFRPTAINNACSFHPLATVAELLNEGSMRLLVVEDEVRITEVLRVALSRAGFAVDAVATVAEARAALPLAPYD